MHRVRVMTGLDLWLENLVSCQTDAYQIDAYQSDAYQLDAYQIDAKKLVNINDIVT